MNSPAAGNLLEVPPERFSQTIEDLERDGYRLLMLKPADAPCEALMQKPDRKGRRNEDELIRVLAGELSNDRSMSTAAVTPSLTRGLPHCDWQVGRAGMMYRDLIPDRLGGKIIASHIRIVDGGPVPDRVHYHKIEFQIIYCLKGSIRVVYEDQGEPFWLQPGDCVLQPPEIRHRVLEAEAGSEVIEITSPAKHETWFDPEIELPNGKLAPERSFGGQAFRRHEQHDSNFRSTGFEGINFSDTVIPHVRTAMSVDPTQSLVFARAEPHISCLVLIDGCGISVDPST